MQNAMSITWRKQRKTKVKSENRKEEISLQLSMASRAYKTLPSAFRKDSSNGAVKRVSSDNHIDSTADVAFAASVIVARRSLLSQFDTFLSTIHPWLSP